MVRRRRRRRIPSSVISVSAPFIAAVGAWLSPVVLAVLAGSVAAGDAGAPALVACIAAASLLAVVAPGIRARLAVQGPADLVIVAGLTLMLAANLVVVGDLARLLGLTGAHGLVAGAVLALAVIAWRASEVWWGVIGLLGVAAVIAPIGVVGLAGGTPWAAWAGLASRSALTFDAGSAWVTGGRAIGERTTLTFSEPHRVAAVAASTWRVSEDGLGPVPTREWRVGPGDALTLRPGDQLTLERGARVRFEAGRRVPTAPASGVAWADGPAQATLHRLVAVIGVAVTLLAGGLALAPASAVPAGRLEAIGVPVVAGAFVIAGALWGLYGIALVPELALAPRALAPMSEALQRVGGTAWAPLLSAGLAAAVAALLAGMLLGWRIRVIEAMRGAAAAIGGATLSAGAVTAVAGGLVVVAAVIGLRDDDPWNLFALGLGLIAAAAVAPRLAGGSTRSELLGAIVGTVAFVAVALDGTRWPMGAAFMHHPAVVAAPLAWLTARFIR
jgi:hypothetical protein